MKKIDRYLAMRDQQKKAIAELIDHVESLARTKIITRKEANFLVQMHKVFGIFLVRPTPLGA